MDRPDAYHLAGHVGVALLLSVPLGYNCLYPGRGAIGSARPSVVFRRDVYDAAGRSPFAVDLIVCAYSGFAARCLVHHNARPWLADADAEFAYKVSLANRVFPPHGMQYAGDEVHRAHLAGLRDRAITLVRQLSDSITRLADTIDSQQIMPLRTVTRAFSEPDHSTPRPVVSNRLDGLPKCSVCGRLLRKEDVEVCGYHRRSTTRSPRVSSTPSKPYPSPTEES